MVDEGASPRNPIMVFEEFSRDLVFRIFGTCVMGWRLVVYLLGNDGGLRFGFGLFYKLFAR